METKEIHRVEFYRKTDHVFSINRGIRHTFAYEQLELNLLSDAMITKITQPSMMRVADTHETALEPKFVRTQYPMKGAGKPLIPVKNKCKLM